MSTVTDERTFGVHPGTRLSIYAKENGMKNGLWGTMELAEYLGIPKQTIYQWRTKGYGPPGCRIGKYVKYLPSDVERWIEEQRTN